MAFRRPIYKKNTASPDDVNYSKVDIYSRESYHTPDTVEAELGMLITISSLLLLVGYIPMQSTNRDELKKSAIEDNLDPNFYGQRAVSFFWTSILLGATALFMSIMLYTVWRSRRPHYLNHEFAIMYMDEFKYHMWFCYLLLVVEGFVLAFSAMYMTYIKISGDSKSELEATAQKMGLADLITFFLILCFTILSGVRWSSRCHRIRFEQAAKAANDEQQYNAQAESGVTV